MEQTDVFGKRQARLARSQKNAPASCSLLRSAAFDSHKETPRKDENNKGGRREGKSLGEARPPAKEAVPRAAFPSSATLGRVRRSGCPAQRTRAAKGMRGEGASANGARERNPTEREEGRKKERKKEKKEGEKKEGKGARGSGRRWRRSRPERAAGFILRGEVCCRGSGGRPKGGERKARRHGGIAWEREAGGTVTEASGPPRGGEEGLGSGSGRREAATRGHRDAAAGATGGIETGIGA